MVAQAPMTGAPFHANCYRLVAPTQAGNSALGTKLLFGTKQWVTAGNDTC